MVRRSVLFSPGDQPDLLRKAPQSGADVIVFDLEDAVTPGEKGRAREIVWEAVDDLDLDCELCIRINPLEQGGGEDIEMVATVAGAVDSVMLPKVSDPETVRQLRAKLPSGTELPLLALLETASGILDAPAIAAEPTVDALLLGAEDLAADIGATRTPAGEEISYARQRVVLAASAAEINAIDTLVTDFEDRERLEADTEQAKQFGFDGKMAIHPGQIPVINDGFTPEDEAIDWAKRVLTAHDQAQAEGRGVFAVDGEMIDAPLIAQAEGIIERARAAGVEIDE